MVHEARSGLRCRTSRYRGRSAQWLHGASGWRQRPCPTCKAQPGEPCETPSGRRAAQPHSARLHRARRELAALEQVWQELERWGAATALVRFSGGGGSAGRIGALTLEAEGRELARWESGEGELPEALAAPIWGRYARFRGHPRVTGLVAWKVREHSIVIGGDRGGDKFDEVLSRPRGVPSTAPAPAAQPPRLDKRRRPGAGAERDAWSPATTRNRPDRVNERRRAVALAPHYRDQEGLSIGEIAGRLGRAGRPSRPTSMTQRTITKDLQIVPRANAGFGATRAAYSACADTKSPLASAGH